MSSMLTLASADHPPITASSSHSAPPATRAAAFYNIDAALKVLAQTNISKE